MEIDEAKRERVEAFMLEEFPNFLDQMNAYQWPSEAARWRELAFCLLSRVDDSSEGAAVARETIRIFRDLDLLNVDSLASTCVDGVAPAASEDEQLALMVRIMERQGYSPEQASEVTRSLCEAANTVMEAFDGKIQKLLRGFGETLLDDVSKSFVFSSLDKEDAKYAFAHWLQNVANLPVRFSHPSIDALCRELDVSPNDLVMIADENDLNLALLDDWATDYMEKRNLEERWQDA